MERSILAPDTFGSTHSPGLDNKSLLTPYASKLRFEPAKNYVPYANDEHIIVITAHIPYLGRFY